MSLGLEKKLKGEAKFLHFGFRVSRPWITEKGKEARNILSSSSTPKSQRHPSVPVHSSTILLTIPSYVPTLPHPVPPAQ